MKVEINARKLWCPECGHENLMVERRPDGDAVCVSCGVKSKYKDCIVPADSSPKNEFKPVPIASQADRSVREILQHMLDRADEFTGVVVVANCKNGEQYLRSSKQNCKEKSYLLAFFQAWVMGIFRIQYDEGETN